MSLKILFVFATVTEADILKRIPGIITISDNFRYYECDISVLITGVGGISTAWAMKQWLDKNICPDLAVNAGTAGSFSGELKNGEVVMPVSDCFADMGIENGSIFRSLSDACLMNADTFPFRNGYIEADNNYIDRFGSLLKKVRAITVNTASGSTPTIEKLIRKYNPDIETMEGATFFYICSMEKIPFMAVRAISNRVEPYNKKAWDIPLALDNLSGKVNEILLMMM